MKIMTAFLKGIISPMDVMRNADRGGVLPVSGLVAALCVLLGAVALPVSYYLKFRNKYEISLDVGRMIMMLLVAIATWFAACAAIWAVSLLFGKGVGYRRVMASWGLSYIPDLFCLIAYGIIQMYVFSITANIITALIINTFFIMMLVWKAIFYFIEMRFVLKLEPFQLLLATMLLGIVFIGLMQFGFSIGLQVPML